MALIRSEALPRKRKVPKELVQAAGDQMAHGTRWREQRFRPEAPKVSIPEPVAVGALRIRADDLCCFPFGTPRTPDFRFCCEPVVAGRPYCAVHMAVAYVHVQPYQVDDDYDR
jgi:GcrA cell cycle regulator